MTRTVPRRDYGLWLRMVERTHNVLLAATSLAMLVGILYSCVKSGKTASVHDLLCKRFDEEDWVFQWTSQAFFW